MQVSSVAVKVTSALPLLAATANSALGLASLAEIATLKVADWPMLTLFWPSTKVMLMGASAYTTVT